MGGGWWGGWWGGVGGSLLLHQSSSWRSNGLILGGGERVAPILTYLENYSCFCIAVLVAGGGGRFRSPIYVSSLLLLLQICRELATIFLRDNDNAPIFAKIGDNATSDIFSASRHCRVVAKIVASAQLCKYVRKNLTGNKG